MRTVFLNTLAQWFQAVMVFVNIIAILSALCAVICICIHIQSLGNREVSGRFCISQLHLCTRNCLCKAFCPNYPAHLANGLVQIHTAACDF